MAMAGDLGKVFRARCGEYFNNRLDKVRIGKAKTFLAQGMRVFQVAQLVGYADADYFQQKFKKCTGSTPSAWRAENCRRPSGPPEAPDRIQG